MKGQEEKSRRIETGSFHTVELCGGDLCYLDTIESVLRHDRDTVKEDVLW
jgi:hypothetical protein